MPRAITTFEPLERRFCLSITVDVRSMTGAVGSDQVMRYDGQMYRVTELQGLTVVFTAQAGGNASGGNLSFVNVITRTASSGSEKSPTLKTPPTAQEPDEPMPSSRRPARGRATDPAQPELTPADETTSAKGTMVLPLASRAKNGDGGASLPSSPSMHSDTDTVLHGGETFAAAAGFVAASRSNARMEAQPGGTVGAPMPRFVERIAAVTGFGEEARSVLTGAGSLVAASVTATANGLPPLEQVRAKATDAVVGAAAATVFSITPPPQRYFGFSPLSLPYTLVADSVAAFAEESATLSAAVATARARARSTENGPWNFTLGVLAADVFVVAYIHRRRLRSQTARAWRWPELSPAGWPAV